MFGHGKFSGQCRFVRQPFFVRLSDIFGWGLCCTDARDAAQAVKVGTPILALLVMTTTVFQGLVLLAPPLYGTARVDSRNSWQIHVWSFDRQRTLVLIFSPAERSHVHTKA